MVGKAFAGFVVTFWLVTMVALVRLEFFPKPLPMGTVPSSQVLRKIFANPKPARLNVIYRDLHIGHCSVEITPMTGPDTQRDLAAGQTPQTYRVTSELTMTLSVFGLPSRMHLEGSSVFDAEYAVQSFDIRARIPDGKVQMHGDKKSNKVNVKLAMADFDEERSYSFNQVDGAGLANALGLPGLAGFGFTGGDGTAGNSAPTKPSLNTRALPVTTTSLSQLDLGDGAVSAFLIESKMDDSMWARIWVDEAGDILLVETSLGLKMEDYHLERTDGTVRETIGVGLHRQWRTSRR